MGRKNFESGGRLYAERLAKALTPNPNGLDSKSDPRDKIAQDAGFKDYEEMKGYQDYVTQKNLLKKKSTKSVMRLLYQQEVTKYEKDHADLIKRIGSNN